MKTSAQIKELHGGVSELSKLIVAMNNTTVEQLKVAIEARGYTDLELNEISNFAGQLPHSKLWNR